MGLEDVRQNEEAPCILEKQVDGVWSEFADLRLCAPNIRKNPETGELEYSTDDGETWTSFPPAPVPPREEINAEALCLAAANAVNVLVALHQEVTTQVQAGINNPLVIAASLVAFFAALIVYPPAAAAISLIIAPLVLLLYGLSINDFTEEIQESLICMLFENAEQDEEGVVTFDFATVLSLVQANAGIGDMWRALDYYMQIIAEDGLNRAGATTAITDYDCTPCLMLWCYYTNFGAENDTRWTKYTTAGTFVNGDGWRGTSGGSSGDWEEVGIEFVLDTPAHMTEIYAGFYNEGAASYAEVRVNGDIVWSSSAAGIKTPTIAVDIADAETIRYYVRCTSGQTCRISEASFSGDGHLFDFGDQDCEAG